MPLTQFRCHRLHRLPWLELLPILAAVMVLAGCATVPPPPSYSLTQPDVAPPAHAALLERDRERLTGADELLRRPDEAEGSHVSLLSNRASARLTLGQNAGAIADLQEAIRRAPASAGLRLQLARALWALDHETEAREQVAAARALAPQDPDVNLTAGLIDFAAGQWEAAALNFELALSSHPGNGYGAVLTSAARRRVSGNSSSRVDGPLLRAMDRGLELWPAPVAEMMLGRISADELRQRAEHPDPIIRQTWQTEVSFYLGELAAVQGDETAAAEHYRTALRFGVPNEIEYVLARARLRALGHAHPETDLAVIEPPDASPPSENAAAFHEEWSDESKADLELNRLVRSGAIDRAIVRLREMTGVEPSEERLRMLAALQAQSGRASEALETWRASLRGDASDWQALAAIGWLEFQLAMEQGTTAANNAIGHALFAAFDPWAYSARREGDRHLAAAREAFERALGLRPDDLPLVRANAQVKHVARDYEGSLLMWQKLRTNAAGDLDAQVGEASALTGLKRDAEAQALLDAVLAREPNHTGAHAAMAELARRAGRPADARRHTEIAQFCAKLPPGSRLQFSPNHVSQLQLIAPQFITVGPYFVVSVPESRAGVVRGWLQSDSDVVTELLATAWWNPPPDDPETLEIARALHQRGQSAMLRTALERGGNPAALGAAAHALAQAGDASIVDRVIDLLQQDQGRLFVADFAGALATLGEFRAAMPLAAVLDPDFRSSPRFSLAQQELTLGYRAARARAALALASFDSAYAKAVLEAGTHNPEIAIYCHAALFAQTKEPVHLSAIESALRYTEVLEARRTFALLRKTGDPVAAQLADAWEKRSAARRKR